MAFETIIGHERAIRLLKAALRNGCLSHAYLFHGPDGIGKKRVARGLAQSANCTTRPAGSAEGCGHCSSCRAIAVGTHPDVTLISPDGAQIRIAQIRALQDQMSLKPIQGRYRFAIIDRAECLNTEAANALLKSLEEPPGETVLILITARPDALLPTLLSRCQKIRFAPPGPEQVRVLLEKVHPSPGDDATEALLPWPIAGLGDFLSPDYGHTLARYRALRRLLDRIPSCRAAELTEIAQDYGQDRELTERALLWIALWLRECLLVEVRPGRQPSAGAAKPGAQLETEAILRLTALAQWIHRGLHRNLNRPLALETLLLQIRALAAGR